MSATGPSLPSLTNPVVMRPLNAGSEIQPAIGVRPQQDRQGSAGGMLEHAEEPDNRHDVTGDPNLDAELADLEKHTKVSLKMYVVDHKV